jgi:hypothetical protein
MKTLHDAVSPTLFSKVKSVIESEQFPWYYVATTAYTDKDKQYDELYNGSFAHVAFRDGKKNSECSDMLEAALYTILDKMNIKLQQLHRIRIGYLPVSPVHTINPPHIDVTYRHKVGLLYLNDADGDTYIYNEKYDPSYTMYNDQRDSIVFYEKELNKTVTVMEQSAPQANKFITFDGLHFHSSSTPTKTKRRLAVNYVYSSDD